MRLFVPQNYSPISKVNDVNNLFWLDENYRYLSSFTKFTKVSVDYFATIDDYVIEADCTTGSIDITLPNGTEMLGKQFIVVLASSSVYPMFINLHSGASTAAFPNLLQYPNVAVRFMSIGAEDFIPVGLSNGRLWDGATIYPET